MGYSARSNPPPWARPPRESGVPPLDPEARRRYFAQMEERLAMGSVPPPRPVPYREKMAARPPKPPRPLQSPPSREERISRHCVAEAEREIRCLVSDEFYRWQPYREPSAQALRLALKR